MKKLAQEKIDIQDEKPSAVAYEIAIILKPAKNESGLEEVIADIKKQITDLSGPVRNRISNDTGSTSNRISNGAGEISEVKSVIHKILAYPIEHQDSASYVFLKIRVPGAAILDIQKYLKEHNQVLRFLFIKQKLTKIKIKKIKTKTIKSQTTADQIGKTTKGPKNLLETAVVKPKPTKEIKVSLEDLDKKLDQILDVEI